MALCVVVQRFSAAFLPAQTLRSAAGRMKRSCSLSRTSHLISGLSSSVAQRRLRCLRCYLCCILSHRPLRHDSSHSFARLRQALHLDPVSPAHPVGGGYSVLAVLLAAVL